VRKAVVALKVVNAVGDGLGMSEYSESRDNYRV
jgi:hypothetical protein